MITKEYIVYRDSGIEALNHLDDFQTKMEKFLEIHTEYTYTSHIKEKEGIWEILIKLNKDEQTNLETT